MPPCRPRDSAHARSNPTGGGVRHTRACRRRESCRARDDLSYRRCHWRPRLASWQQATATGWSPLGDAGQQLFDVGRPDSRDLIIARITVKRAVAPRGDIAERGRFDERVDAWIQEAQRRFPGLLARLVHQSAQPRPDRGTPTGAANLRWLIVEYQKGAGVGISRGTHVGDQAVGARRHAWALLPGRPGEEPAGATATARPAGFRRDGASRIQ